MFREMLNNYLCDCKNMFKNNIFSIAKRYIFLTFYGIFKYLPSPLGDILRMFYLKIFLKKLDTVFIREGTTFHFPENISIGKSAIGEFVYFNGYGGIEIGDKVLIGNNSILYSHDHVFSDLEKPICCQGLEKKPIVIKDNVFIGCSVVILGEVVINQGAVVAAGSVVTKDVPENSIVAGVPARIIGDRVERDKKLKIGR